MLYDFRTVFIANQLVLYLIAMYLLPDHPWLQNIKKAPNVNLGETVKARLQQFSVMNKFKKHALRVNSILVDLIGFLFQSYACSKLSHMFGYRS